MVVELAQRANLAADAAADSVAELEILLARMRAVRDECDRVRDILDRVTGGLDPQASAPPTLLEDSDEAPLDLDAGTVLDGDGEAPPAVAYPGTGKAEPADSPSDGIRLLATQMAMAGESIADIERRLRSDFGVRDAHLVVRELFGTG